MRLYLNGMRIEYININLFLENYPSDIVIFLVTINKYEDTLKYLTNFVSEYCKGVKDGKIKNLNFFVFFDKDDNKIKAKFEKTFKSNNNLNISYNFKFIDFENVETLIKAIEEVVIEKNKNDKNI